MVNRSALGYLSLTKIHVRNFRSIDRQELETNWITTFVGQNDAGKSNVLRALNLFFNNETDLGEPFDFDKDFNKFAKVPSRKAPQVEVELYFSLPHSYQRKGFPNEVKWKKVWRFDGPVRELEHKKYSNGKNFQDYSKIPVLLDRIRYNYVPAIKDPKYFTRLQGDLYKVLASVAEKNIRRSALDFENNIQSHIQELLSSLSEVLSTESFMRLPEDLTQIFENLEFASDEIPLSRRGDGIKIRYIPKILRFMAEKENSELKGTSKYFHIWGFEEPENNVEMSAAFDMANQFVDLIGENERYQILLTTHSPVFYGLRDAGEAEGEPWLASYFVEKDHRHSIISKRDRNHLDQTMGMMPLVSPYIEEAKKKYDALVSQQEQLRKVAEKQSPTVFVEGETDKALLERSFQLFAPDHVDKITFYAGGDHEYGSANAVSSRALSWAIEMRHRPENNVVLALALFDDDNAGKSAKKEFNENVKKLNFRSGVKKFVKILTVPASEKAIDLMKKGYIIPIDIESLYPDELWRLADTNGWIADVEKPQDRLNQSLLSETLFKQRDLFDGLTPADNLRVWKKFTDDGKEKAAAYITSLEDIEARAALLNFEKLVTDIVKSLQVEPS